MWLTLKLVIHISQVDADRYTISVDTLVDADRYAISVDTLVDANSLSSASTLVDADTLKIISLKKVDRLLASTPNSLNFFSKKNENYNRPLASI
jgi:hypothetical protein